MASPFESGWNWVSDRLTKPRNPNNSYWENVVDEAKKSNVIGPYVAGADWLFTDREEKEEIIKPSLRDNPWANQYYSEQRNKKARIAQANQAAMDNLRNIVQETPMLTNDELRQRARKKVAPIFRPQIRETRRSIRQTERQGRVSANQVQGYYDQAGQKVAGMSAGSRKAARKSARGTMSGGVKGNSGATAESRIAANATKGMGKANASFFKQLQGALAGEGAVAAADTRRNYKDLANEYRGDLADLRSQKAAAMQQAVGKIRNRINDTARTVYNDSYLQLLQQGVPARKAQAAALAQAGTYGQQIEAKAAQMILNNKGNEKLLAATQKKKGLTDEQWDRRQDKQRANEATLKGWQVERDAAQEEFDKTGSEAAKKRAAIYQAKINAAYGG